MSRQEDWKQCYDWLVRCSLLLGNDQARSTRSPSITTTSQSSSAVDGSQLFDFAQMLLDGVLLCNLANRLHPGAIDQKEFCARPQMSQFLCLKNIRVFLTACKKVFCLKDSDIFDANELFEMKDFGKVLNTLSVLSNSVQAQKLNIQPFTLSMGAAKRGQYYNTLPLIANEKGVRDEPLYGVVDCEHDDAEDDVYGRLVDRTRKTSTDHTPAKSKREMCVKELELTERNYVDALQMLKDQFMKPLKEVLQPTEFEIIFFCIERLHTIHSGFCADLSIACGTANVRPGAASSLTISDCFITWKEKFLIYGEFCSSLPHGQDLLDRLCAASPSIQQCVTACQMRANEGRFKLRDLLSVPLQRVLKYHLLLKELIKRTERGHPEKKGLEKALDEMMDLSTYVNEVKRDNEALHLISDIESSIFDLQMPANMSLKDYGRLLKDGELKIRVHSEQKTQTRYAFLFDKVLLLCKPKGDQYSYKSALVMGMYHVEDTVINVKANFGYPFLLGQKNQFDAITIGTKTPDQRTKWMEAMRMALDNTNPPYSRAGNHDFQMASFNEATICDVCRKLLRGVFYQGYKCTKTNIVCHKECLEKAMFMTGPPRPPPRPVPSRSLSSGGHVTDRPVKGRVKMVTGYQGVPAPPGGRLALNVEAETVVDLLANDDSIWWEGRYNGREGFFPRECARLLSDMTPRIIDITDSMPTRKAKSPSNGSESSGVTSPLEPSRSRPDLEEWVGRMSMLERSRSSEEQPSPTVNSPHRYGTSLRASNAQSRRSVDGQSAGYVNVAPPSSSSRETQLNSYQWFVGGMSRDDAARKLERLPNGTFLIRVSQSDMRRGEYALSIKYGRDPPVKHIKLQQTADGSYFLADSKMFHSIVELIQYYQQNSLESSFPEVPSVLAIPYKDAIAHLRVSASNTESDGTILGYCLALYDYAAMEPNQISLRSGDRIAILSKAGGQRGWWKGSNKGKIGYFPTTFVSEAEDEDRSSSVR